MMKRPARAAMGNASARYSHDGSGGKYSGHRRHQGKWKLAAKRSSASRSLSAADPIKDKIAVVAPVEADQLVRVFGPD